MFSLIFVDKAAESILSHLKISLVNESLASLFPACFLFVLIAGTFRENRSALQMFDQAVSFRREFGEFAEKRREMTLVFKTGAGGDFDERQIAAR